MKEVQMSFRAGKGIDEDATMMNLCFKEGFFIDHRGGGNYVVTQYGKKTLEEFFTPEVVKQIEADGAIIKIIE